VDGSTPFGTTERPAACFNHLLVLAAAIEGAIHLLAPERIQRIVRAAFTLAPDAIRIKREARTAAGAAHLVRRAFLAAHAAVLRVRVSVRACATAALAGVAALAVARRPPVGALAFARLGVQDLPLRARLARDSKIALPTCLAHGSTLTGLGVWLLARRARHLALTLAVRVEFLVRVAGLDRGACTHPRLWEAVVAWPLAGYLRADGSLGRGVAVALALLTDVARVPTGTAVEVPIDALPVAPNEAARTITRVEIGVDALSIALDRAA
jgi:hypothetical protein